MHWQLPLLVVCFDFIIHKVFEFEGVKVAADHQAQVIRHEFHDLLISQDVWILVKNRAFGRANASRRELISGGMQEQKMMRVVGLSSAVLFDLSDPFNPVNRRISIIVMSKKAGEALSKEGGQIKQIKANTIVDLQAPRTADAS
jgi:hypothetical protein